MLTNPKILKIFVSCHYDDPNFPSIEKKKKKTQIENTMKILKIYIGNTQDLDVSIYVLFFSISIVMYIREHLDLIYKLDYMRSDNRYMENLPFISMYIYELSNKRTPKKGKKNSYITTIKAKKIGLVLLHQIQSKAWSLILIL